MKTIEAFESHKSHTKHIVVFECPLIDRMHMFDYLIPLLIALQTIDKNNACQKVSFNANINRCKEISKSSSKMQKYDRKRCSVSFTYRLKVHSLRAFHTTVNNGVLSGVGNR